MGKLSLTLSIRSAAKISLGLWNFGDWQIILILLTELVSACKPQAIMLIMDRAGRHSRTTRAMSHTPPLDAVGSGPSFFARPRPKICVYKLSLVHRRAKNTHISRAYITAFHFTWQKTCTPKRHLLALWKIIMCTIYGL